MNKNNRNNIDSFLSKENFVLAYNRLKTSENNEFKQFYYHDFRAFEAFLDKNIEFMINELEDEIYKPTETLKYFMPKKKNLARPITLLSFKDLLVYQAIINVVAKSVRENNDLDRYYGNIVFGNILTHGNQNIFFYERWKTSWRNYNGKIKEHFSNGYTWIAEFDIASFYDTIDHNILKRILLEKNLSSKIVDLLISFLSKWLNSINSKSISKSSGIPQGPSPSSFLSEVILFEIDKEIEKILLEKLDIKYIRYADDIKIMAKEKIDCEKAIVYLDLLCRDFSLIPQSEKIILEKYDRKMFKEQMENGGFNFSKTAREHRSSKELKTRTHKNVKKKFMDEKSSKSIKKFALYRLNKDDDIKNYILQNFDSLRLFLQEVLVYFNKHYPDDQDVLSFLSKISKKDQIIFQYDRSLVFRNFDVNQYNDETISKYKTIDDRFWIIKLRMLQWLNRIEKYKMISILKSNDDTENHFINVEFLLSEIKNMSNNQQSNEIEKNQLLISYLESDDSMLALIALNKFGFFYVKEKVEDISNLNKNIKYLLSGEYNDYLKTFFKDEFNVSLNKKLYDAMKKDEDVLISIKDNLRSFKAHEDHNPLLSIEYLNNVNHALFDIICETYFGGRESEYGGVLSIIKNRLPNTWFYFDRVNNLRNNSSNAHYKDKYGVVKSKNKKINEIKSFFKDKQKIVAAYNEINILFEE